MALTPDDVARIAQLARLQLSADEQGRMRASLNEFFSIVERMRNVDTSGTEPLYTPLSAVQQVALRLREDEVSEPGSQALREASQRSAPAVAQGLYLVPKVIE
jgi:aspartyl-tRNA(Asn)/glutamyl-tRNA(Gln) amidotransferase subunit C